MKRQYVTDSKLEVCGERLGKEAYRKREYFRTLFKPLNKNPNSLFGNVHVVFSRGKAKLIDSNSPNKKYINSYEQISSALALYRAVSIFECGIQESEQDWYKCNWSVLLKHQKSGQYLMLGEWKGGFNIFTEAQSLKDLDKQFIADCEELLTWFVSQKVPIGYDGVIAGSVA